MKLFSTYPAGLVMHFAVEMYTWDSIERGIPPKDWDDLNGFQQRRWMSKAIKKIRKDSEDAWRRK